MDQKTKIVATLGPATQTEEQIENLIKAGVDVFRFNLKHNNHDWHANLVKIVRKKSNELKKNIAILADLQGPELLTSDLETPNGFLTLEIGSKITFGINPHHANKSNGKGTIHIPFNQLNLVEDLQIGSKIYIDDGKIEIKIEKIHEKYIEGKVTDGGELGSRRSVSIPHARINTPSLSEKDKNDLKLVVGEQFDFVALSFVRDVKDIATLRDEIKKLAGTQSIVSKIETLKAVHNIESIIDSSDGIMVARGDLGVEVPIERVPKLQKRIIELCREKSKPVIVATQMLLSMVKSTVPTRAEVADIANSVFDKTDALMLSEETAIGDYPIKTVNTMAKIARYNEDIMPNESTLFKTHSYEEIIIAASVKFSHQNVEHDHKVKGYIVFTESGKSAQVLSRFRPNLPIFAFSRHEETVRKLALSFGVDAFYADLSQDPIQNTKNALHTLKEDRGLNKGDKLIVIFGNNVGVPESNNTLSIVSVG